MKILSTGFALEAFDTVSCLVSETVYRSLQRKCFLRLQFRLGGGSSAAGEVTAFPEMFV